MTGPPERSIVATRRRRALSTPAQPGEAMHAETPHETAGAVRGRPGDHPATASRRRSIGRAMAKAAGGVAACVLALSTGSALAAPADPNVVTTVTQNGGERLRVH